MPWPRTSTEKLLADMFEGASAQFLAIMESLTDSNRRTLLTSPPSPDNEPEILDVYAELFLAAQEILAGEHYFYIFTKYGSDIIITFGCLYVYLYIHLWTELQKKQLSNSFTSSQNVEVIL